MAVKKPPIKVASQFSPFDKLNSVSQLGFIIQISSIILIFFAQKFAYWLLNKKQVIIFKGLKVCKAILFHANLQFKSG